MSYTASIANSEKSKNYMISFRHPLLLDSKGKPGRKVHRSSKTPYSCEANSVVRYLNEILQNESMWKLDKQAYELSYFPSASLDLFFDPIKDRNSARSFADRFSALIEEAQQNDITFIAEIEKDTTVSKMNLMLEDTSSNVAVVSFKCK